MLSSLGLHLRRGSLGDDWTQEPLNLQRANQWNRLRLGVWTSAGVAGAYLVTAMPLLLRHHNDSLWRVWVECRHRSWTDWIRYL